jgi:hypothetical protein
MPPGSADEQKQAAAGTVEAWARSGDDPAGGRSGTKGLRGRFAMSVPPLLEELGLEHNACNDRVRARIRAS